MGYKQKSTDEHYTPPHIYEIVKDWAEDTYKLAGKKIIRPFYPGEDYQRHDYDTDCVVIDNPPFSILSEITSWYIKRSIRFFYLPLPSLLFPPISLGSATSLPTAK